MRGPFLIAVCLAWLATASVAVAQTDPDVAQDPQDPQNQQVVQTQIAPPVSQPTPPAIEPDQDKEIHPTPAHTGWATLVKDTGADFMAFPRRKSTWALLGIGAAAALATHPADNYVERHIVGSKTADRAFMLGQWLGSTQVQVGTSVGLWAVGRYILAPVADEPQTNWVSHLGFDMIRAQIMAQTIVHGMKYTIRRDRPTGECCSFPSGHSATAFAVASVIERHLGYRASVPAIAAAFYVATSRLVDNRHFISDVMFGAGIGMASGWTIVGRHGRRTYALQPVPVPGGMMIALARQAG
jgi:membrane-associated phospholipid phosphatase